jgi:hypothetical protein
MLAYTIADEPIILESDSRSEDRDDNFRILDSKEVGHDALDLDILPVPFNFSAEKLQVGNNDDSDNSIDNNIPCVLPND